MIDLPPVMSGGLTFSSSFLCDLRRAKRWAVRFFAAASDAFLARADRSSGVMFCADVFPPSLPNFFPRPWRYSSTSGGIRLPMR